MSRELAAALAQVVAATLPALALFSIVVRGCL